MANGTDNTKAFNAYFKSFFKENEMDLSDDDVADMGQAMDSVRSILERCMEVKPNDKVKAALQGMLEVSDAYIKQASRLLQ